jgi:hypothetical protein
MGDQDPSPFRDSSLYDQETDQIVDINVIMATQGNGMAIMTTDVNSIACHSSKLEDIFDAIACSDITANLDSIINRETFVSKSPISVNGLSGFSAGLLPWLFMDALHSIAGPTADWLTDYTDPLMHRN